MYDAKYHLSLGRPQIKSCLKHHISATKYSSCQTKQKTTTTADQTIYGKASKFTEVIDKTFFSKEIEVMTLNWGLWWHTEDTGPCLFSIYLQLYSVCSICLSERSWLAWCVFTVVCLFWLFLEMCSFSHCISYGHTSDFPSRNCNDVHVWAFPASLFNELDHLISSSDLSVFGMSPLFLV